MESAPWPPTFVHALPPSFPCWLLRFDPWRAAASTGAGKPEKQKPKVVLYKDRLAAQWDTVKCVKNVIKLNPLMFFRGEIPIYYERALSPQLSPEPASASPWRNYLLRFVRRR
ncbi:MAG: hypothetical protein IPI07_02945 [Flavobacteriales bacterium]|nr:hypothetical protein [Flavobacteriales bacterium]